MRDHLINRFALLGAPAQDALPRHQKRVRSSTGAKPPSSRERTVVRLLRVFVGRFTLEVVESVWCFADVPTVDVLDVLQPQVDKSLVTKGGCQRPGCLSAARRGYASFSCALVSALPPARIPAQVR
jgi:predicted ATPase